MRTRMLALSVVSGAALLAAAALPAAAFTTPADGADSGSGKDPVSAAGLLARVKSCTRISDGKYRTDQGGPAKVPVCGTKGAVFWEADMDIDCDGRITKACSSRTDPSFLPETAFQTSAGRPLDSARLPYVVVPGSGPLWNHTESGIRGGTVAAVVYRDQVQYAVVGDTGPTGIIGEASYATAEALGIDPDPKSGGTASGVTYILFKNSEVSPIESRKAAVTAGEALARKFVDDGSTG
ncbi:glycoside hydrolase family 75 protein [Streptomyces sp. NBC_01102]|uniref:glycoside hydrolase family 75 protein n=1 Tax=unclassified Streptomyces TaxID=2593676 RepID=UPI0038651657|nr:glycoside hydrolase family 75 protein [Streptomyces sp. NBC_01102]